MEALVDLSTSGEAGPDTDCDSGDGLTGLCFCIKEFVAVFGESKVFPNSEFGFEGELQESFAAALPLLSKDEVFSAPLLAV